MHYLAVAHIVFLVLYFIVGGACGAVLGGVVSLVLGQHLVCILTGLVCGMVVGVREFLLRRHDAYR